jgi:hypothetical protein
MEKKMIDLKKNKPKNPPSSENDLASKKLDKIEINPKEPADVAEHTEEAVALTHFKEQLVAELKAEGLLDEAVLSLQQRMKRRSIMRAHKVMYAKARERAEKRMATPERLKARAQAQARQIARKRFAGQRGVEYQELTPSDKIAVDKLIDKKGALIKKIASRLLPVVRKKEVQRLASFRSGEALKSQHSGPAVVESIQEADLKATSDFKIVIDKDGKERKVRAHRIAFAKEELVSFSEMQQQAKKRGRPASPETLAKRAAKAQNVDKDEDEYGPDNGREADQNIIIQLQKAVTMNGKKAVEFDSGSPVMVKPAQAEKALNHYMNLKKPAEKLEYMKKISTSFANFKKMLGEEEDKQNKELLIMIESVMNRIEETYISEEAAEGLKKKAEKSGVPLSILRKVYNRGMAAWKTSHRPGTTPQQWAFARVNSYITKGKGTYYGADKDLREEMSASTKKAREAHFKKMSKKSDSDPSAYVPAPGDATAKTKLSKHTLKYRDMFGEENVDEACWSGYKQIGLKDKNGKKVPNCVPIKESGGEVVYKSGKNHIEKYSDDSYAVYKDGVKKFFYNTLAAAKSSLNEAMTPQEKFKSGLKKAGYDPDAGAKRLTDLLAKQKKDREEHEKKYGHLYGDDKKVNEEAIIEDAAAHLRTASALQQKGKPQLAAFHRKIAAALQRGDAISAARFKQQLAAARAKIKPATQSIKEQIEYTIIDYSNMKPVAAPTVAEMKEFMGAKGGFEHHPEVKKIMSLKEMRAKTSAYTAANPENDPNDQVFVGSYRTQHFEASPEAQKLYMNLPKDTNPNVAAVSAVEHDKLLHLYKKVILSKFATPEDIESAKTSAAKIMKLAGEMDLSAEHGYINGIIRNISDSASDAIDRAPPSANLDDDPRFKTLPKDLNQEPGPGNDKDIDNLKNYLITRNIKAQRKLKIIDND